MGCGISSLSKVCIVGPPSRPDADVDYTFAQVSVREAAVDYGGNCGNMSSAVGSFAVAEALVARPLDGEAVVRIHNTNTAKIIGLYAAGELVGGIFYGNHLGGARLMSGAVFGRLAGERAGQRSKSG